jgi:DNA-binding Lrp family transcriptional regulator
MSKDKLFDLLYELMKNSKRSDRELAKVVDVSQPTITRLRKGLEQINLIREYTVLPALDKLGFEVLAFNYVEAGVAQHEGAKTSLSWVAENSKILFASSGEGLSGKTLMMISIHKDFSSFTEFSRELRSVLGPRAGSMESFLVSLKTDVIKHFSFRDLERI